jgi:Cu2+-containing amine oxidase
MRVSDFFVPYHSGQPRFYDLSFYRFKLSPLPASACPASAGGTLLSSHVCQEVHDRGVDWMDSANAARRGQQITLWGSIDAANYRYLESYTFRDDGTIVVQAGATGQNFPGLETETHVHNALWRLDLDVDGTVNDPSLMQHSENAANPAGTATDPMNAIATAQGLDWRAQSHESLVIANTAVSNGQGHHPSYHLMPLVDGGGLTRHFEDFTRHDFWVTPYNAAQMAAKNLVGYTAGSPSVSHRDIVVWYKGSLHHHPRDEDGIYKGPVWHGTAHAMMTGFMLVPVDVFDCSPFYGGC